MNEQKFSFFGANLLTKMSGGRKIGGIGQTQCKARQPSVTLFFYGGSVMFKFNWLHSIAGFCGVISLAALATCFSIPHPVSAATIVNPSFEADEDTIFLPSGSATGWLDNAAWDFSGYIHDDSAPYEYVTDGHYGAYLYSRSDGTFLAGDNVYLKQSVDLTGATTIMFDAQLSTGPWQSFLEAGFYVDSVKKWSKQALGTYADQSIDVTGLSGTHSIEFRLLATTSGNAGGTSCWYQFDNVRLVPEPSTTVFLVTGLASLLFMAWRRRKRS